MTFALVALTGSLGAICRYLVSGAMQARTGTDFPIGTLIVNLTGALAIGIVAGGSAFSPTGSAALLGFLGGYTTFSTWMIETIRLGMPNLRGRSILNLALTLVLGVTLTAAGYSLAG